MFGPSWVLGHPTLDKHGFQVVLSDHIWVSSTFQNYQINADHIQV